MTLETEKLLKLWAGKYNDPQYFHEDPIAFPRIFAERMSRGLACSKDVETAAVFAAHFAWGRRAMIVRDCNRLMDEMDWKPYDYVMKGGWRDEDASIHRTVKWSDVAQICMRLRDHYERSESLENLGIGELRTQIFGQKADPKAANKKICMMRRWMIRQDGKVDIGIWKDSDPRDLIIPLDVHVYTQATALGLTARKQKDFVTASEITDVFRGIWPEDPCLGDFALFGYGVTNR